MVRVRFWVMHHALESPRKARSTRVCVVHKEASNLMLEILTCKNFNCVFYLTLYFREQLKLCHQNTKSLMEQRNEVEKEMIRDEAAERR